MLMLAYIQCFLYEMLWRVNAFTHTHTYIYIYREREREREVKKLTNSSFVAFDECSKAYKTYICSYIYWVCFTSFCVIMKLRHVDVMQKKELKIKVTCIISQDVPSYINLCFIISWRTRVGVERKRLCEVEANILAWL